MYGGGSQFDDEFKEIPNIEPEQTSARPEIQRTYYFEIAMITIATLYLITYFVGKEKNKKIANAWLYAIKPVLDASFQIVGLPNSEPNQPMQVEGNNIFKYCATGHNVLSYALTVLELNRRDDFLSMFWMNLIWPVKDKMTIEIPLKNVVHPTVFAILRKGTSKTVRNNYPDLKAFTSQRNSDVLPSPFCILAENDEIGKAILDQKVRTIFQRLERFIEMIHISDQKSFSNADFAVKCDFYIPKNLNDLKEFATLISLALYIAEQLVTYKMSPAALNKANKERRYQEEMHFKEQKAQRDEDFAKKRAQQLSKLTEEQLKKRQDKEYKKQQKRMNPKVKMVKA